MKWGGRKTSSFISHASPFSWLSKLKQMRINSEPNPEKQKHKGKQKSSSFGPSSPQYSYGGDDGSFWRQSIDEESHEDKKSKDSGENVIPSSSWRNDGKNVKKQGRREGSLKLKKDVGVEERKLLNDRKVSMEMDEYNREMEYECLRRRFERKAQKVFQEQLLTLEKQVEAAELASNKAEEKEVLQFESPRTICTPRIHSFSPSAVSKNSSIRNIQSFEKTDRPSEKKLSFERQNLRQTEELKIKTNKQRQPHHGNRELQRRKPKQSPKVRIYSPRMASKVEICKIKALEDIKKAKLKMKKEREEIVDETQGLDSFAVIKRSLDPRQDFRDSMVEMIMEKQISQPDEMEELLACYLTLNADEYHDLIIKVFRQVWFDLSQYGLGIKPDMQFCCYE